MSGSFFDWAFGGGLFPAPSAEYVFLGSETLKMVAVSSAKSKKPNLVVAKRWVNLLFIIKAA